MTVTLNREQLGKTLLLLENDLEGAGWDQPAAIYFVSGDPNDPHLTLAATLLGHPVPAMQEIYDDGARVPDNVIGIALATEGWRHLQLEELEEVDPQMVAVMRAATKVLFPDHTDEELDGEVKKAMGKLHQQVRPSELPSEMRVEIRNVFVVFPDGTSMGVIRDRDQEPKLTDFQSAEITLGGRVPDAMHHLLRGERPTGD